MRKIAVFTLLALVATGTWALPLTADFIIGQVERQVGTAWKAVNTGDKVDSTDTVRIVGPSSKAEFSSPAGKISLTKPGSYRLEDQLKEAATLARRNGALAKLGKIVDPKAAQAAITAGVRGAQQGVTPDMLIGTGGDMWMTDEEPTAAGLSDKAKDKARDGQFAEAAEIFGKAAEKAKGEERAGYLYSQAWCLYAAGPASVPPAIKVLSYISPAAAGAWAVPRALLLARMDLDVGAAADARALLTELLASGKLGSEDKASADEMLAEASQAKK
jgi:hypothetical protein